MQNIINFIGILGSVLFSIWAFLKYIVTNSYRLDNELSKKIIDLIKKDAKFEWVLLSQYTKDPKFPDIYEAFVYVNNVLFKISRTERLLTAGYSGKEELTTITFARWNKKIIDNLLNNNNKYNNKIKIMAITPYGADRLGEINCCNTELYLEDELYQDMLKEADNVSAGVVNKTGFLLYGTPGNGKTQFAKYLAKKYSMDIIMMYLNPEYDNLSIALMFASIPPKTIVLFEDFDNYFNGREIILKNNQVKFTFDSIINGIDGVYNDYKQNIFIMTANDINKIDDSLKCRPSRFKFVKEFGKPSYATRIKILNNENEARETDGMSLDEVFSYKSKKQ